jgi:SEC-C motif-containing protein
MAGFGAKTGLAPEQPCPCGGASYGRCCRPLHRQEQAAATAEQLMRSRYSAFALAEIDHLLRTQPSAQPTRERRRALEATCRQLRWRRLEILASEAGGPDDLHGTVTFAAHYSAGGEAGVLRECSRFGREAGRPDGAWLYLEALELSD